MTPSASRRCRRFASTLVAIPSPPARKSLYVVRPLNIRSRIMRSDQRSPRTSSVAFSGQSERRSATTRKRTHKLLAQRKLSRGTMRRHVLAVLVYVVATFATQAVSHFGVNAAHYAAITYLRPQPVFALGILSMLIQGSIMAYLYAHVPGAGRSIGHAVVFAWLVGGILVSYEALAEAAKYNVPGVGSWIAVEPGAGVVQFTLYGALLGWVHRARVPQTG